MNDTRKAIIELIEPYMEKTLILWCLIKLHWHKDIINFLWIRHWSLLWWIDKNNNEINYFNSWVKKIIGHYDISAVLKYIWKKDINISVEYDNNCFYIEILVWQLEKPYFPMKPLNLYTEQEENDLLKLLSKLKK